MKRDKLLIAGISVLTVVGASGVGVVIAARRLSANAIVAPAHAISAASAPLLAVAPPTEDFVGVLLPPLTVNVAPRIDGKIATVDVELGSVVPEGALLSALDARLQKHDLEMARASYGAARAATAAARVEVERARDHSSRRSDKTITVDNETLALVSGEEAAQARFDEHSASAKFRSSGATAVQEQRHFEQSATMLGEHELRAPFDCVVAARYMDPGAYVKAGEPVVRIVATGGMLARFAVPEERVGAIRVGDQVHVSMDHTVLDARVERISPEVEPASRTVFVEAKAEGAGSVCKEGCSGLAGRVVRVTLGRAPASP